MYGYDPQFMVKKRFLVITEQSVRKDHARLIEAEKEAKAARAKFNLLRDFMVSVGRKDMLPDDPLVWAEPKRR